MCGSEQCAHCALLYASFRMNAFILLTSEMVQRIGQCSFNNHECPEHGSRFFLSCSKNRQKTKPTEWIQSLLSHANNSLKMASYTLRLERERERKKATLSHRNNTFVQILAEG